MKRIFVLMIALLLMFIGTNLYAKEGVNSTQVTDPTIIKEVINIKIIKNESLASLGKKIIGKNLHDTVYILVPEAKNDARFFAGYLALLTLSFLGFVILTLVIVAIWEKYILKVAKNVKANLLKSFLIGILGMVLIVPIALVLLISIVGIILIPIEIIIVLLMFILGFIVMAHLIGEKLLKALKSKNESIIWSTLLGLIILWLILWIPVIGALVKIVIVTIGFGAIILTFFQKIHN
ncbi:MAG: hypothetical protein WC860_00045 [Candidatus Margulisiibacteriota bacterium]|jgi:hypothetical protein